VLPRLPEDIGNPDEGVLDVRGHYFDIVAIEGDELEFIEGLLPSTSWAGQRSSAKLTQGFGDSPEAA